MARRGVYRGLYSSLVDDPDFQALTPNAKLALLIVRICSQAGPAAIFRYYPELLARQTGLSLRSLETALTILEQSQPSGGRSWIEREGVILWVRNGLRHDPNRTLANSKHRAGVSMWLESLPHLRIVLKFCDYYSLPYPFDSHALGYPPGLAVGGVPAVGDKAGKGVGDEAPLSRQPDPPKPPGASSPALSLPASIVTALDQTKTLGAVQRLRCVDFWQAEIRANNGVEYAQEILKAEAWLSANPSRAPRKDLARFLHNWIARAGER